jgi:hypothetical protein
MTPRRRRTPLPVQLAELSVAAPMVVAARLARIAAHGATPTVHDRRELHRMGAEKFAAWQEGWIAMARHAATAPLHAAAFGPQAFAALLAAGLAPAHRRAVANARRLHAPKRRKR